jgi:hypothetical protein
LRLRPCGGIRYAIPPYSSKKIRLTNPSKTIDTCFHSFGKASSDKNNPWREDTIAKIKPHDPSWLDCAVVKSTETSTISINIDGVEPVSFVFPEKDWHPATQ